MKQDCEICRGSGIIRLPIYRRAIASYSLDPSTAISLEDSSRSYPCPECSDSIPQERLAIVRYHSLADSRIDEPEYIEYAKRDAGHLLVSSLVKAGFVSFKRGPNDAQEMTFPLQATIGVVSPKQVATLETRIAEHQETIAREVMAEAERRIRHWGSYYNHQSLHKDQAVDSMRSALRYVLAKRSSLKPI